MADPLVLYDVDDKVGVVTLNRPDKLNAISHELQQALSGAFARADADPATSVVLLRAEGRSFCAGYDIGAKGPAADDWRSDPTKAHAHLQPQLGFEMAPWLMKKPVIASVQRLLGGGCELVMLCDLTIAADDATFGEPEVRFSAVGPAIVMPMIIGYKRARELLYFGGQIDAQTALDFAMINRIVPLAELRTASLTYAKRLSLISPKALYATKCAVNRVADAAGFRTALYAGLDVVGPLYATATEHGTQFRGKNRRGTGRCQVALCSVQSIVRAKRDRGRNPEWQRRTHRRGGNYGREHHELALREVDGVGRLVDQHEAQRDQRIHQADHQAAGDQQQREIKVEFRHAPVPRQHG